MPIQMSEQQLHDERLFPHDEADYRVCNVVVRRYDAHAGAVLVRVDLDEIGAARQPINTFPYMFDVLRTERFNQIERAVRSKEPVELTMQRCNVFWMVDNKLDPDDPWREHAEAQ